MSPGKQDNIDDLKLALTQIKTLSEDSMNDYQKALLKWHRNVDKRYAWVILATLFCVMSSTLGSYRVYSLIYAKVTAEGVYNREEASWPVSVIYTVENLIGPLVSVISYRLTYHQSIFIGGLLMTLGNGLCAFSKSLKLDVLLLGIVQGIGYAFIYTPFMEIVNSYFLKYRSTALGIALCGGTISIFGWSPLFQLLLDNFPWRYSYLGTGLVCSLTLIMAFLLKPNPMPQPPSNGHYQKAAISTSGSVQRQDSVISMNSFDSTAGLKLKISGVINGSSDQQEQQPSESQLASKKISANYLSHHEQLPAKTLDLGEAELTKESEFEYALIWEVLKTPAFHMIWYSELIYFWIFTIYCLVIVDYASDRDCSQSQAEAMLSYQSVGELIGRLVLTVLVDMRFMSNKNTIILVLIILAIQLFALTQVTGYLFMAAITVSTFSFVSVLWILLNGLLVDYLGERQVTLGYGMASCIGGALMSFRPQAVGYFRDNLGSYDPLMWCLGGSCLLSALLWLLEPLITRCLKTPSLKALSVDDQRAQPVAATAVTDQ